MRSFVVILIAALVMAAVITGLLAFVLPVDLLITRIHAATAPVFAFFVIWHFIYLDPTQVTTIRARPIESDCPLRICEIRIYE